MKEFKTYHPLVNFIYFVAVIGLGMFLMHPVCLIISLVTAFSYSVMIKGKRAALFGLLAVVPMMLVTAFLNPLFNHQGLTVLAYLPDGNPLTLESVAYGIAAASMIGAVICWFSCFNAIVTGDKFMYLFGKVIPSLSLVISMTLRFVPRFREQYRKVSMAQMGLGNKMSDGNLFRRMKRGVRVLSAMVTWMLENSVETSASMKCRGYGLPGRTSFSLYSFTRRDFCALAFLLLIVSWIVICYAGGGLYFSYFPMMISAEKSVLSVGGFAGYLLLCAMPIYIEVKERMRWNVLKSKI